MNLSKRHPLFTLLLLLVLGSFGGMFAGGYFYHRHAQEFRRGHEASNIGAPAELGDAALFYLSVGTSAGTVVGLLLGIAGYDKVKGQSIELQRIVGKKVRG